MVEEGYMADMRSQNKGLLAVLRGQKDWLFGTRRLCATRTSCSLLLMDSEIFSKLRNWNWSCFLDLVKQTSNPDLSSSAADITVIADIKCCGIQILSVILKTSHIPTPHFSIRATEAFSCFLRWKEFCQDTSLEKAGLYINSSEQNEFSSPSRSIDFNQENCLYSSGLCSLAISSSQVDEIEPPTPPQLKMILLLLLYDWIASSTGLF
ncbi:uncharacterized protein LOC115973296 [Quercus lobata]|uniref:uncharacterized protein LOC115973296 n=1 Tax=Quercus lobata TaxID=97700 RepID=UPI0012492BBC|nr:uncharacterized protein LOC115973296 [Quercus lobata]